MEQKPPAATGMKHRCTRCGIAPHARHLCPAKDTECYTCKRKGHFSSQCFSKSITMQMKYKPRMIIKLSQNCPDHCHRVCTCIFFANFRIARRSIHLGQTDCCICHRLLRGLFSLLMDTAGPCRLHLVWSASDEAQEYWSTSQELALACSLKVVPCSRIGSYTYNL